MLAEVGLTRRPRGRLWLLRPPPGFRRPRRRECGGSLRG
ncbi:DUF5956 family protein [Dactylosporangium siamense]